MEDGREAFGKQYGMEYLDVYRAGFVTPIVMMHCDHKQSLRYGNRALIETTYVDTTAAKIIFHYRILNAKTKELAATGETIQVFVSVADEQLYLNLPPFFEEWKKKMGLI
jgi:acyl-CoA thioester hydrolase